MIIFNVSKDIQDKINKHIKITNESKQLHAAIKQYIKKIGIDVTTEKYLKSIGEKLDCGEFVNAEEFSEALERYVND